MNAKKAYGDFQTPATLAERVTSLTAKVFGTPDVVVEPTCGIGSFLNAALYQWGRFARYEGYEINPEYIQQAKSSLNGNAIFHQSDFFTENWQNNFKQYLHQRLLVLGNPPWVTNAELSKAGIRNTPPKANFQGMKGLDARTGKANFDIAEWMILQLIAALPPGSMIAMLCKTASARKVLRHIWKTGGGLKDSRLFLIDAKSAFNASVSACLLMTEISPSPEYVATVYDDMDLNASHMKFGFTCGELISDMDVYQQFQYLDKGSEYTWRSGIKHDASSIMELEREGDVYKNGLGERIHLENDFIFPLLKSSDIGNGRIEPRKYVLIPQRSVGDDTANIRLQTPETWEYLNRHSAIFSNRRSSIYKKRPPFSVFGIGHYSFALWKVAVSGLYKTPFFVAVPPVGGKPVMLDDTCYALPCQKEEEARLICELMNSESALSFLRSLTFPDNKRPITANILQRLSLSELACTLGKYGQFASYCQNDGERKKYQRMLWEKTPPQEGALL